MSGKTRDEIAADQKAFWNGPGGQAWLSSWERIQRTVTPFGQLALEEAAPRPGERVLDVGCGTGQTTADLARAVGPQGHVLGVDVSETLLAVARAEEIPNAAFVQADAATQPLDPASLDLVFSRFGVMFFADPVPAFANFRQALKDNGRIVFVCWRTPRENPWVTVPLQAGQPFLAPINRPGPEDPGPFAFGDTARVERIFREAGLAAPTFRKLDRSLRVGATIDETLDNITRFGPLVKPFAESPPDQVAKAKAAIGEALKPYVKPDGVFLDGACWLVRTAKR
jgi:SAM-dependent methyltransferase